MKKVWAIVMEEGYDLVDFEFGDTPEEALQAYVQRAHVPEEDARLLYAIPGDKVWDNVKIPGWLLSALEYGPDFAFGPEESSPEAWEDYRRVLKALAEKGVKVNDIVGWVRVNSVFDMWAPVVK